MDAAGLLLYEFILDIDPPRTTAQQKKIVIGKNGKPRFYEPDRLKYAREILTRYLLKAFKACHVKTIEKAVKGEKGAVFLKVDWYFKSDSVKRDGEYKTTRPDTDNLQKLLKDCMTDVGFWEDDAQVVKEEVSKRWGTRGRIEIEIRVPPGKNDVCENC